MSGFELRTTDVGTNCATTTTQGSTLVLTSWLLLKKPFRTLKRKRIDKNIPNDGKGINYCLKED